MTSAMTSALFTELSDREIQDLNGGVLNIGKSSNKVTVAGNKDSNIIVVQDTALLFLLGY